jgi:hypothetical protein
MAPPVIVHEGLAYLADPSTGHVRAVPVEEARGYLAQGIAPATTEQAEQLRRQEYYSTAGQQVRAGAEALARGATIGLSDLLLSQGAAREEMRYRREANPTISTVGDVGGAILGLAIPGGPLARLGGAAAKVGAGATRGVARVTAREGLQRAAGAVAREATFGAGLGAGHALSDIALEDMTPEEQSRRLLLGMATGAGLGGGLGVLSFGAGSVGRAVSKRLSNGLSEVRQARKLRDGIRSELDVAKAAGALPEALAPLEAQLARANTVLGDANATVAGKIFGRALGAGLGLGLDMGVTGGAVGAIMGPRALKMIINSLRPGGKAYQVVPGIGRKVTAALEGAGERLAQMPGVSAVGRAYEAAAADPALAPLIHGARERLGAAGRAGAEEAEALAMSAAGRAGRKVGTAAGRKIQQAAKNIARKIPIDKTSMEAAVEAAGHAAGEAIGYTAAAAASGAPILASAGTGLVTGGAVGAGIALAKHGAKGALEARLRAMGDLLMGKFIPAGRVALLESLSDNDLDQIGDSINHMDPDQLELVTTSQLPSEMPAQVARAMVERQGMALNFLQANKPPPGRPDAERRYREMVRATLNPGVLIEGLAKGRVRPEHLSAWEAVYPEALGQLKNTIRAETERARIAGARPTARQAVAVARILGEQGPKMYDPQRVAALQGQLQPAQPGPKPRPQPVSGLGQATATQTQRLQKL